MTVLLDKNNHVNNHNFQLSHQNDLHTTDRTSSCNQITPVENFEETESADESDFPTTQHGRRGCQIIGHGHGFRRPSERAEPSSIPSRIYTVYVPIENVVSGQWTSRSEAPPNAGFTQCTVCAHASRPFAKIASCSPRRRFSFN